MYFKVTVSISSRLQRSCVQLLVRENQMLWNKILCGRIFLCIFSEPFAINNADMNSILIGMWLFIWIHYSKLWTKSLVCPLQFQNISTSCGTKLIKHFSYLSSISAMFFSLFFQVKGTMIFKQIFIFVSLLITVGAFHAGKYNIEQDWITFSPQCPRA